MKKYSIKKIRGIVKYLVQQKGFTAKNDTWKKKENLKNTREVVAKFKGKMSTEVKQ